MQKDEKNKTMAAVAIVVALVIGMGGGYAIGNSMNDNNDDNMQAAAVSESSPRVDTKAAELRVALDGALTSHIAYAVPALEAAHDGAPSLEGDLKTLDNNSVAIATAVDSVYPGTKDSFLELWRNHIGFFADYTKAAKAGDQAGMEKAKKNLEGYTDQASTFFSDANPNLPKEALQEGLTEHFNQVIAIVNAYGAGEYEKAGELQTKATAHMSMTAKILSSGIVKQSPDKF
jgi:hypothetical protein